MGGPAAAPGAQGQRRQGQQQQGPAGPHALPQEERQGEKGVVGAATVACAFGAQVAGVQFNTKRYASAAWLSEPCCLATDICHPFLCPPQRKTPERQPCSVSRLAPDGSPVAAAAATARDEPQLQRRRSSEEEGSSLVPKQLFVAGGEGGAASPPAASSRRGGQQRKQAAPKPACEEWAAFKAFMASPRRPVAGGAAGASPAAQQAAEQPQQAQPPAQQDQQQPMDVDGSQQESPAAAATPATAELPRPGSAKVAAAGTAASPAPASRTAAAPLSPKQGQLAKLPADLTPEKLLPAPGLCSSPVDKENGCSLGGWDGLWDDSACGPEAWPAPAAGAGPSGRSRPPAAVRRGLLLLQSPATERAAAAREQMASEAAEVLAADVLRLLRWVRFVVCWCPCCAALCGLCGGVWLFHSRHWVERKITPWA